MTKIVPAILVKTMEDYSRELAIVRQLTNRFQLDIIDGEYADNKTIELGEIARLNELSIDIHLMVRDPKPYVEKAMALRANNTIIQLDCCDDITPNLIRIKKAGLNAGVAINPTDQLKRLKPIGELIDHILIMGYQAGFAGQKLNPIVFDRLQEVRKLFPGKEIGLDGGVNSKNAKKILQAGFDVVNVNTLIFGSSDPLSAYSELLEYSL